MSPVGLSRRAPPDAGALKRIYAGVTERRADPAWRAHTDAGVCMVGVHNRAMGRPGVAGGTRTPMCVHASADTEHVYVHCWLGATSAAPAGRPGSWRASCAGRVLLARRPAGKGGRGAPRRAGCAWRHPAQAAVPEFQGRSFLQTGAANRNADAAPLPAGCLSEGWDKGVLYARL